MRLANVRIAMTTPAFVFMCASVLFALTAAVLYKANRKYRYTNKTLNSQLANQRKFIDEQSESLRDISCRYKLLHEFLVSPVKNLDIETHFNPVTNMPDYFYVVAISGSGRAKCVIKTFKVENSCDEEDVEFAAREAKELIETIEKA